MVDTNMKEATVAERFAAFLASLTTSRALPADVVEIATRDLIDAAGLCLAARPSVYMRQVLDSADGGGPCTAIGHAKTLSAQDAALANGVAIHGEDFDDTLEGAPIRVGAHGHSGGARGRRAFPALPVPGPSSASPRGLEAVCRLNHVAAGHMHRAGFHPVGVIGALGAAAGRGRRPRSRRDRLTAAFGRRRQHVVRHHRISDRRCLDQAPASGLGRTIRLEGRPDRQNRLFCTTHRVRRRP